MTSTIVKRTASQTLAQSPQQQQNQQILITIIGHGELAIQSALLLAKENRTVRVLDQANDIQLTPNATENANDRNWTIQTPAGVFKSNFVIVLPNASFAGQDFDPLHFARMESVFEARQKLPTPLTRFKKLTANVLATKNLIVLYGKNAGLENLKAIEAILEKKIVKTVSAQPKPSFA